MVLNIVKDVLFCQHNHGCMKRQWIHPQSLKINAKFFTFSCVPSRNHLKLHYEKYKALNLSTMLSSLMVRLYLKWKQKKKEKRKKKIFYFMPDDIKDGKIFRHITAHSINFHQMLPICAIGLNLFVAHTKSLRLSILV